MNIKNHSSDDLIMSPQFADECLSQSEEKNERDDEAGDGEAGDGEAGEGTLETKEDVDGTKTVLFICSFGASCLEKWVDTIYTTVQSAVLYTDFSDPRQGF